MYLVKSSSKATILWCKDWWSARPEILPFSGLEVLYWQKSSFLSYICQRWRRFQAIVILVMTGETPLPLWRAKSLILLDRLWMGQRMWTDFLNYSFYNIPTDLNSKLMKRYGLRNGYQIIIFSSFRSLASSFSQILHGLYSLSASSLLLCSSFQDRQCRHSVAIPWLSSFAPLRCRSK